MSASKSRVYSASPTARARKRMLASVFLVGAGERAGALLGKRTVDGQLRVADDLLDLAVASRSLRAFLASEPLILRRSTRVATVIRRYDWTSLLSLSVTFLSRTTACWALSLTAGLVSFASSRVYSWGLAQRCVGYGWVCGFWVALFFCACEVCVCWRRRSRTLALRPLLLLLLASGC